MFMPLPLVLKASLSTDHDLQCGSNATLEATDETETNPSPFYLVLQAHDSKSRIGKVVRRSQMFHQPRIADHM